MANFIIKALDVKQFAHYFSQPAQQLAQSSARFITADQQPGYPCRVSLTEAQIGEKILLLPFEHHNVNSPYRASGPIFVREHAKTAKLATNEVPQVLSTRLLSLRAYDAQHMMVRAHTFQGKGLTQQLCKLLDDTSIAYIQIHNANPGCFACQAIRAD